MLNLFLSLFLIFFTVLPEGSYEQKAIHDLQQAIAPVIMQEVFDDLQKLITQKVACSEFLPQVSGNNALFRKFPMLSKTISYMPIADLPTPITNCPNVAQELGLARFEIKRDDLTGKKIDGRTRLFGGNKVRKLEFLLADVCAKKAKSVMTFGCVGSNHALATAVYAHELGLQPIIMLLPQANSLIVQRNLLLDLDAGARMVFAPTNRLRAVAAVNQFLKEKLKDDQFPYIIPTGGSCALGIIGYVNAAFELKEQIDDGVLDLPSKIYVPVGSCGTYVGLLLGLKAAGVKSNLVGVSVEPGDEGAQLVKIKRLFKETNLLLHEVDPSFPLIQLNEHEVKILHNFTGKGYALFTKEGFEAIKLLQEMENITLDGVYSGKALAGLVADVKNNEIAQHERVLFWNTFCADDFNETISLYSYKDLPHILHPYFESKPLQDLLF